MSWFLVVLFLSLTFNSLSEYRHDKRFPSAVVVGTVYCDICFQQELSMGSHFISGASVALECKDGNSKPRLWKEVKTNEHGEFEVQLPFSVSKHVKRIRGCNVKLISSSDPYCAVASTAKTASLRLKSRTNREIIFSAGFFSFNPLKQPNLCNQNPSVENSKEHNSVKIVPPQNVDPSFPPPLPYPTIPGGLPSPPPLPRLPELPPLPQLPSLPPLPRWPWIPPVPGRTKELNINNRTESSNKAQFLDKKVAHSDNLIFPPNPLLPPPTIPNPFTPPPLIPNPCQPPPLSPNPMQPPTAPLIPSPFQPPSPPPLFPSPFQPPPSAPSPLFPFPPIPGSTPSPPPIFLFSFPPLLLPPRSPGTVPASSSKNTSP